MLWSVVEFLIGWIVLPRVVFLIFGLVFLILGVEPMQMILYTTIIEGVIIALLFFVRKALALGYLLDYILEIIGLYTLITGFIS